MGSKNGVCLERGLLRRKLGAAIYRTLLFFEIAPSAVLGFSSDKRFFTALSSES